ncbi:hypothetical protein DICPUDRAFT_152208 [Dictyostelium purpureum]|uniref:Beta-lactamase-related domain-containing protein n=1 Tax=Dictyostelium purpureum TaxID=5786 RepID=F0ZKR4_DICPU|nr:uncharacterized protein DICPUDRAFT_152208 [Dictyostelium purpureum]EGC35476.1 hypothetical protein DICPUDRAFT_152208 [Dictyostelium purpureum]|eukprot:XP_003288019.1 hypothetical protein DICPUDRAFT_152208 [Dictyostelium purpureum]
MKFSKFIITILVFVINLQFNSTCPTYPQPVKINQNDTRLISAYEKIDSFLQNEMKANNIESFVASIVYMDEVVWSKAYGNVNPLDISSDLLTIDNNVQIASLTKLFTDLMMYQLRDKGIINSIDDQVEIYYPEFSITSIYDQENSITLRELSGHLSGLPRELPCDTQYVGTDNCTEEIILKKVSQMFTILPQNQMVHYSNLGVSLLGNALSKAIQMPYEQYIENYILKPLEMTGSTFNYSSIQDNLALGVQRTSNGSWEIVENRQTLGWSNPSGGLFSTTSDISKFIIFLLNGNEEILKSSTLNEMLLPMYLDNDGSSAYGTPFEFYYDSGNEIWYQSKAGIATGYRSQVALSKDLKLGLFYSSQYSIYTEDLFTRDSLQFLIPIYTEILLEQQQQQQLQQQKEKEKIQQQINDQFIGYYSNDFNYNFNIYLGSNQELIGNVNGNKNINFTITDFDEDYPLVKRVTIEKPQKNICWMYYDGLNEELIYFYTDINDNINSLLILGQTLYKQ